LLISGDAIPDFLEDKIRIDFRTSYFEGIARLTSVIHEVPEYRIPEALSEQPAKLDAGRLERTLIG